MKKISILIPCYNEEENVIPISDAVVKQMLELGKYDYEILFIDNCSKDKTRDKIEEVCAKNKKVRAIFNTKNFGQFNSPFYGLLQTTGDCTIPLCADFQDPIDVLPRFITEWENGYRIVCGIKKTSKENKLMYFLRSIYYKMIRKMSDVEMIEHFTGFGLYDKSFIDTLRQLDDPTPFLRGIVAELGSKRKDVIYEQARRIAGKTSNNWYTLYDGAMLSFTSYTKIGLRIAVIIGFVMSVLSLLVSLAYLILKLLYWDAYTLGTAPLLMGVFLFGSLQLFFIGMIGEYIMSMNLRIMKRPLVVEERRINFDENDR